jgi:hypothetical protein
VKHTIEKMEEDLDIIGGTRFKPFSWKRKCLSTSKKKENP